MVSVGAQRTAAFAALAATALALASAPGAGAANPKPPKPEPSNSGSGQYGKKVAVCSVTAAGKQRTIMLLSKGVPAYLATHPRAYVGACWKPRHVKPTICIKLTPKKLVAVWVPAHHEKAYLKRNAGSFRTRRASAWARVLTCQAVR